MAAPPHTGAHRNQKEIPRVQNRIVRRRWRHWPEHRRHTRPPGPSLSRRGPQRSRPAQGVRRRSAGRDRHLEPGRARLGAGRRRGGGHADLHGGRELLAVRAAPRVDAQDTGGGGGCGGEAPHPDRHRVSLWPGPVEPGARRPPAQAAYLQGPHAQGPGGLADAGPCRRPHPRHRAAPAGLLRPRRRGQPVAPRRAGGGERWHGRHGRPARPAA
ncbi:hypothetical protein SDC9_170000 [bioreactor metagenome]|uniref:Uncharacterized protein n=1 Tax=bioreactor metagenome TaxID=1076179 RepID=A0A645G6V0_9ZZZZ